MTGSADILALASAFFCAGLSLAAVRQKPACLARWAFVLGMVTISAAEICGALTNYTSTPQQVAQWQIARMAANALVPGIWLCFALTYARGNHNEFLKRWRYLLVAAFALPVGVVVLFGRDLLVSVAQTSTGDWVVLLGPSGVLLNVFCLMGWVLILMNLEQTFRSAVGTMRWRIKSMILGLVLVFVVRAYVSSQTLLFHTVDFSLDAVASLAMLLGGLLVLRSLFRAGSFNEDVYPAQTAVHTSLTIILAGVYLLIVGVFAKLVWFFGGATGFTFKAFVMLVSLLFLAVAILSDRLRLQARLFFSRHFQRPFYDYRAMWRRVTEETAACEQPAELCQASVKLVADIFEALSATLWLVDERREILVFAASTFLSEARGKELQPTGAEAREVIRSLENHPEPFDLDASSDDRATILKRCHPDEFIRGGNRICAPLASRGELLGLIILGDRVGGVSYTWQDFDLLKCVADQIASSLLNVQLSQRLLQAKQMEAFQTMSTFFVHDLKNTASRLNLMLNNLPEHFNDPEFRADALRGIANTVGHINSLIERLSLVRHELQIKPVPSDLNEMVMQALSGLEDSAEVKVVRHLGPVSRIPLDQEQILKVVTNLVLNAREAVLPAGEIRVETSQTNGWLILTVADNGSGMTQEFMARQLFRPFQTSKKNGLGIGLFQSRIIVEAHRGRIEVASQPGKGSTFQVFLPVPKAHS